MNNALDLHAILQRLIKNQVLLEMPDSPHSQHWEFAGFTRCTKVGHLRKFEEGITGFSEKAPCRDQATVLADVGIVPDKITPCGRPYDSSVHAGLSLLPGSHEGKPGAFDLDPIVVRHLRRLPAGLGFFDESIHTLLPMCIDRDRVPNAVPEAQKQSGRFLKELFATGELPTLNSLIDAFLEVGWQSDVHHAVLPSVFYARRRSVSPLIFMRVRFFYERSELTAL